MKSDLNERLKKLEARAYSKDAEAIRDAITALSPVLPDDVAEVCQKIRAFANEGSYALEAVDLLERQEGEIAAANLVIKAHEKNLIELQAQVKELKALNPNGIKIVTTHPPEYYAALQENE